MPPARRRQRRAGAVLRQPGAPGGARGVINSYPELARESARLTLT